MVKREKFKEGIRCQRCNMEIFTLRGGKKANRLCPTCSYDERQQIMREEKKLAKELSGGY